MSPDIDAPPPTENHCSFYCFQPYDLEKDKIKNVICSWNYSDNHSFKDSLVSLWLGVCREVSPPCTVEEQCSSHPVNRLNEKEIEGNIESAEGVDMTCAVTDAEIIGSVLNVKKSKDVDKKS